MSDGDDVEQAYVALPTFNAADIGPMQSAELCETFLR